MINIKLFVVNKFRIFLLTIALLFALGGLGTQIVHAQLDKNQPTVTMDDSKVDPNLLDYRMSKFESYDLPTRMTRLEDKEDNNHTLLIMILGSVGALAIETIYRILSGVRK